MPITRENITGTFWDFLQTLEEDDRENFVKALGEDELLKFSSSQEEFAVITGRDPKRDNKSQTERQKDVRFSEVKREDIQKRYDEFKDSFPEAKSIEGLKRLGQGPCGPHAPSIDDMRAMSQPSVSVTINLGQIKEKAGIESPRNG